MAHFSSPPDIVQQQEKESQKPVPSEGWLHKVQRCQRRGGGDMAYITFTALINSSGLTGGNAIIAISSPPADPLRHISSIKGHIGRFLG
jgi:hypothetical protein